MKGARRRAIAGLLCVCGVFGCAQLPARGLFARRINPAPDEARVDDFDDATDDDAASIVADSDRNRSDSAGRHQNLKSDPFAAVNSDRPAPAVLPHDSNSPTYEPFDTSSRCTQSAALLTVEAPPPNRRTSSPPAAFVSPPQAREIAPNSIPQRSDTSADHSPVMLAHRESTALENSSEIELAAAQARANTSAASRPNPWDRFRGLTNKPDTNGSVSEQPLNSVQPHLDGNNLNYSVNAANSPEPWPRAPGAIGFNSSTTNGVVSSGNWNSAPNAPAASVSPNLQWVNAGQPVPDKFPPTASNPQSLVPAGNVPLNICSPEGAPLAIVPFASSSELERLITQTTAEAAAVNQGDNEVSRQLYLRKQVQLRLLHLISGQTDRALQPIPGIDPVDQEFWQQMLWGLANYFDTQGMPDSSERATQTITQLRTAAARLQERARLELHNVAFCHKISGFGNYQRFRRDEFTPGQQVLLYAEVADFKSEPTSDGQYRTLMKSTLEVLEGGPTGRLIESLPLTPSEDRCRSQRRDYYHSYDFAIPQSCKVGPHTLRLRVEDQLGKKTNLTTLNFTVQ